MFTFYEAIINMSCPSPGTWSDQIAIVAINRGIVPLHNILVTDKNQWQIATYLSTAKKVLKAVQYPQSSLVLDFCRCFFNTSLTLPICIFQVVFIVVSSMQKLYSVSKRTWECTLCNLYCITSATRPLFVVGRVGGGAIAQLRPVTKRLDCTNTTVFTK